MALHTLHLVFSALQDLQLFPPSRLVSTHLRADVWHQSFSSTPVRRNRFTAHDGPAPTRQ